MLKEQPVLPFILTELLCSGLFMEGGRLAQVQAQDDGMGRDHVPRRGAPAKRSLRGGCCPKVDKGARPVLSQDQKDAFKTVVRGSQQRVKVKMIQSIALF